MQYNHAITFRLMYGNLYQQGLDGMNEALVREMKCT
jgi:hypothetical protein